MSKLLRILEMNAGDKLTLREVLREVSTPLPNRKDRRKKPARVHRPSRFEESPQELLAELELLGYVKMEKDRIIPVDPFVRTGRVSVSPGGLVFVVMRGSASVRDIFVAPEAALDALPGDEVSVRLTGRRSGRFQGEITEVTTRARSLFRMKLLPGSAQKAFPGALLDLPSPLSAVMSASRMPTDMVERLKPDTIVIVKLTGRRVRYLGAAFQEASFVRFERDTDLDPDFARVLMKYNFDPVYPEMDLPLETDDPEYAKHDPDRRDLTALPTVTIDGPTAKDFDDAISLEPAGGDRVTLYVHIADVSHYVLPGTELDTEALRRATSVYLTGRVVPMLPPILSENLCSLVANRKRYAFTAEMTVSRKSGRILASKFYKSVIKVDKRLTYEEAERLIDRPAHESPVDLPAMWALAQKQKAGRMTSGRVDITIPETEYVMKGDKVDQVVYKERLRSSMLIEEFMLSANQATAEFLRKRNVPALFRVHEPMDESKLETLNNFFAIYGLPVELKDSSHSEIVRAQAAVKKKKDPLVERIFHMVLLRSFMQATYKGNPLGHWGLGFKDYTHFTSPIRRYPDLVVHRVLDAVLRRKKLPYTEAETEELGFHTSDQERRAMEAERDMVRLKLMRLVEAGGKKKFNGFLTAIRPDRVMVELTDVPVEGVVERHHLTDEPTLIKPDDFSVFIKKLSRPAFLGEQWELELDRMEFEEMRMYFRPVWPGAVSAFRKK